MLKPINAATCPKCRSKNTARGGYLKEYGGSAWKCKACNAEFIIKTMILIQPPLDSVSTT